MSERRDSNSRPRPWQGRALPTELLSLFKKHIDFDLPSPSFVCAKVYQFSKFAKSAYKKNSLRKRNLLLKIDSQQLN